MKEEFEYGDVVEVRDRTDEDWRKGRFLALDEGTFPYVVRRDDASSAFGFSFCRKAQPDLKIDDPVWVRDSKADEWYPRHFAGWSDRRIQTFMDGTTSHTNKSIVPTFPSITTTWEFYSLENPEEASS